jgi:hypothetical protein
VFLRKSRRPAYNYFGCCIKSFSINCNTTSHEKLTAGGYLGVDVLIETQINLIVELELGVMALSLTPMQYVVIQL